MSRRTVLRIIVGGVLLAVLVALAAPATAHAEDIFPIVRCGLAGQPPCAPCDIWATFKRVVDLLLTGIAIPIAAFMIVYAGVMMLLAAGNPGKLQAAKTLLTNTFIGIGIILGAWLVTNFLIRSLAKDNIAQEWYKFSCPVELTRIKPIETVEPPPGPGTPTAPASTAACQPSALSAAFGTSATAKNAPDLTTLIACLRADAVVAAMIDQSQVFTYEVGPGKRGDDLSAAQTRSCNFTRGQPYCTNDCQHGLNSCHYGGKKGNSGAQAVDWNSNRKTVAYNYNDNKRTIYASGKCPSQPTPAPSGQPSPTPILCRMGNSDDDLFDELYRAAKKLNCSYDFMNFETDKYGNQHTHMSVKSCDSDGSGLVSTTNSKTQNRDAPKYP